MAIKKVYYAGKCIMTVDMDYVKEDSIYEYFNEFFGMLQEKAYKEFEIENRYESEARKVWKGYEWICELKDQVEQKLDKEIAVDSWDKMTEKVELLYSIMKDKLNADEFELFKKLRNEEVQCFNKLEQDFFAGEGCLDYVWIEKNGRKDWMF